MLRFAPDRGYGQGLLGSGSVGIRPHPQGGYATFPNPGRVFAESAPSAPSGTNNKWVTLYATRGVSSSTDARVFLFSKSKKYQLNAAHNAWTDVSTGAGTYTFAASATNPEQAYNGWGVATVGDVVLTTNQSNTTQAQTTSLAAFADVSGAPAGSCICVAAPAGQGYFVFIGGAGNYGTVTGREDLVAWSAVGNYASWAPSAATQAGNVPLSDTPGKIVAIKRMGDGVVIYKQNAMYLGRYTGDPSSAWAFERISDKIGCRYNYEGIPLVQNIDSEHYFMGPSDFYVYDGSRPRSIGEDLRSWTKGNSYSQVGYDQEVRLLLFGSYDQSGVCYHPESQLWGVLPVDATPSSDPESIFMQTDFDTLQDATGSMSYVSSWYFSVANRFLYSPYAATPSRYTTEKMSLAFLPFGSQEQAQKLTRINFIMRAPGDVTGTITVNGGQQLYPRTDQNATFTYSAAKRRVDGTLAAKWFDASVDLSTTTFAGGLGSSAPSFTGGSAIILLDVEFKMVPAGRE